MGIYDELSELSKQKQTEKLTPKKKRLQDKIATPLAASEEQIPPAQESTIQLEQPNMQSSNIDDKQTSKQAIKKVINQANNIASNNAILQFTETDVEQLREAAYKAQTFRLTDREVEWVKDAAYRLSKEVRRGKVSQVDILRIGIKLFENLLATHKATLLKLLEDIK